MAYRDEREVLRARVQELEAALRLQVASSDLRNQGAVDALALLDELTREIDVRSVGPAGPVRVFGGYSSQA